jgi:hypothetical protein
VIKEKERELKKKGINLTDEERLKLIASLRSESQSSVIFRVPSVTIIVTLFWLSIGVTPFKRLPVLKSSVLGAQAELILIIINTGFKLNCLSVFIANKLKD